MKFANNEIAGKYEEMMQKPIRQMFEEFFANHIELKDEDIEFINSGFKYKFMQLIDNVNHNVAEEDKLSPKMDWIAEMLGEFSFSKDEYNALLSSFPREAKNTSPRVTGSLGSFFSSGRAPVFRKKAIDNNDLPKTSYSELLNYVYFRDHAGLNSLPVYSDPQDPYKCEQTGNESRPIIFEKSLAQKMVQTAKDNLNTEQLYNFMMSKLYNFSEYPFVLPHMVKENIDWGRVFTHHVLENKEIQNYGIFEKMKVRFNGIGKEKALFDRVT